VLAHSLAPEPKVTTPALLADAVGHPPLELVLAVAPSAATHAPSVPDYLMSHNLSSNQ